MLIKKYCTGDFLNMILYFPENNIRFSEYSVFMRFVSPERITKINGYIHEKDKILSLMAEMIARYDICRKGIADNDSIKFSYGAYGKPFLENNTDYHFSYSHTDGCIAFASDSCEIGADVELCRETELGFAEFILTADEKEYMKKSFDRISDFYRIWTAKESYLKYLGVGLYREMSSFSIFDRKISEHIYTGFFNRYAFSVCTERKISHDTEPEIITYDEIKNFFR